MRVILMIAGLVAAGSYAVILWHLFTGLLPESGGLLPFDARVLGYSVADAREYLAELSARGREIALGPVRRADTIFPAALGVTLLALSLRQGPGRLAWLGAALALVYAGVDLAENAAVARLISGPVEADALTVSGASLLTVGKFAALGLSLLLILLARLARRR